MLTSLVLLTLSATVSGTDDPAGIVSKYLPPKADHGVTRSTGNIEQVGLGTLLYLGDTVQVASGGQLTIAYADGTSETYEGKVSFEVPDRQPLGALARIFSRLQAVLGQQYRQGANLATRNPGKCPDDETAVSELSVPVLRPTSHLIAGQDNLSLAWLGGCAPYRISFAASNQTLYSAKDLKRPMARTWTAAISAGSYRLSIADARDQHADFDIVVMEALPASPYHSASEPGELEAVADAAWLANHDDGRWRWESFQRLRPWIRSGSTLAGTYADLIMWGDPGLATANEAPE